MRTCAGIGCGALLLICLGALSCGMWFSGCTLPSDARLIRRFHQRRNSLEKLRRMAREDRLKGRIHAGYYDDKKLPEPRVREYRALMADSGVVRLWPNEDERSIEFLVDAVGVLDVGTYKGYVWSIKPQHPIVDSLDESCSDWAPAGRFCHASRHLDGDWWLIRYEYY